MGGQNLVWPTAPFSSMWPPNLSWVLSPTFQERPPYGAPPVGNWPFSAGMGWLKNHLAEVLDQNHAGLQIWENTSYPYFSAYSCTLPQGVESLV